MKKQLIYFLFLLLANAVAAIILSALNTPKEYYIGAYTLFAAIYGGFTAQLSRKQHSDKYKQKK